MVVGLCASLVASATPPEYKTFGREQRIDVQPNPQNLMRIWMVYIGQGDGLLIQLPPRCNYDRDGAGDGTERVDILIDGGSFNGKNAGRMMDFVSTLYERPVIEHAVISHHDMDHVSGFTKLLKSDSIAVESIYHNGLASYLPETMGFPKKITDEQVVADTLKSVVKRGMAFLDGDDDGEGRMLTGRHIINSKENLSEIYSDGAFHGVYAKLASAIVHESEPSVVVGFQRCVEGGPFISERESELGRDLEGANIHFEVLWPLERPRKYGNWGETINGNSVTFRMDYGDFSMLFTGDHNKKSEERLMAHLQNQDVLNVDVFKVPHHGSSHAYRPFFQRESDGGKQVPRPVLSVASMGEQGFSTQWKHPSPDVVQWLGGAHRVYHTQIHEKRLDWNELKPKARREALHEVSHILIETDGEWFRVVEISASVGTSLEPPSVQDVRRGNGTRWIRAATPTP